MATTSITFQMDEELKKQAEAHRRTVIQKLREAEQYAAQPDTKWYDEDELFASINQELTSCWRLTALALEGFLDLAASLPCFSLRAFTPAGVTRICSQRSCWYTSAQPSSMSFLTTRVNRVYSKSLNGTYKFLRGIPPFDTKYSKIFSVEEPLKKFNPNILIPSLFYCRRFRRQDVNIVYCYYLYFSGFDNTPFYKTKSPTRRGEAGVPTNHRVVRDFP